MKKKPIIASVIILLVFGALTIFLTIYTMDRLLGKDVDFYKLIENNDPSSMKGKYVSLHVDGVLGNYAEMQHKINGIIPAGTDQYYVVWLDNDYVISLKVKSKDTINKLEEITDDTWDYIDEKRNDLPDGIVVKGTIGTTDSKIEPFYKEALGKLGVLDSDSITKPYYLTIDITEDRTSAFLEVGFCLLMTLIGLIMLISNIKNRYN